MLVLMVTSEQHDLLGVLQFEGEEEADDLQTVLSLVHIVTQEKIVEGVDVSSVQRSLPDVEESHEVDVLAVDVSDNLDWRSDLLNDDWLSSQDLSALIGQLDNVLPLAWELSSWLDVLTLLWFEQRLQEHLAKGVIWVLINLHMILLLRVQLLWFLSKLVYGNLSDNQTEIFGSRVVHLSVLNLGGGDVSLV
jgi:hypothetical protein